MRDIRRKMIAGQKVEQCQYCDLQRDSSPPSIRYETNEGFSRGYGNSSLRSIESVRNTALSTDFYLPGGPKWIDFELGNTCNLRCRTCSSEWSSRIASDPLHSKWSDSGSTHVSERFVAEHRSTTFPKNSPWYLSSRFVEGELLANLKNIDKIGLVGGEPMLIKRARDIMQFVIEAGQASRIDLTFVTNGDSYNSEFVELAAQFRSVLCGLSIEAIGHKNEYIRFGSSWKSIIRNVQHYNDRCFKVYVNIFVHAYNMLELPDIIEFIVEKFIGIRYHYLITPVYLSCSSMPGSARIESARRLQSFLARTARRNSFRDDVRIMIQRLVRILEKDSSPINHEILTKFNRFTVELDESRGQDVYTKFPDLIQYITIEGYNWQTKWE